MQVVATILSEVRDSKANVFDFLAISQFNASETGLKSLRLV
jgi:hypothetical protein